ncbi:MAG: HD-GYP domain-containing protein [Pseudomonadota bacterium]
MLKKIRIDQLKPGMFVHDLNCNWTDHPFLRNRFLVGGDKDVQRIRDAAVKELYIDTARGGDVADAPTREEVIAELDREMAAAAQGPAAPVRHSVAAEMARAQAVHRQAHRVVRSVMQDVRLGRAVQLEQVEPVVENITSSILRNSGALLSLCLIKNKDDYTFLHSVSVCTLMVAFCRSVGMDADTIRQAGIGGLLHDTGKMMVPDAILNKPGRLTDEEFALIKRHPEEGYAVLVRTPGIGEMPLDITLHHHERMDGSGYPKSLPGESITTLAQMAAIVDVYDAITSDRCYHKGMAPTEALRKIFEWSKFHFNPQLVQAFLRCIGIYPVGTLVLLESGRLGVVTEQNEAQLLQPRVKVFFSTKSNAYIKPEEIDLSRPMGKGGADRIVGHEAPEKWRVDPARFL